MLLEQRKKKLKSAKMEAEVQLQASRAKLVPLEQKLALQASLTDEGLQVLTQLEA